MLFRYCLELSDLILGTQQILGPIFLAPRPIAHHTFGGPSRALVLFI